jgi:hypothetical protein
VLHSQGVGLGLHGSLGLDMCAVRDEGALMNTTGDCLRQRLPAT